MMTTVKTPLLIGVTSEECAAMEKCFGVYQQCFDADDVLYDFSDGRNLVGILTSGTAEVERIDESGGRTILEHLEVGSVFGEMLMFERANDDSITVVCTRPCCVSFMPATSLMKRCENACAHHTRVVENMFRLVTDKATSLSERVEGLSRRSIREKLLRYFTLQAAKRHSDSFELPFSLSALADYISTDRSAMMRELKKMREEELVAVNGRLVTIQHRI